MVLILKVQFRLNTWQPLLTRPEWLQPDNRLERFTLLGFVPSSNILLKSSAASTPSPWFPYHFDSMLQYLWQAFCQKILQLEKCFHILMSRIEVPKCILSSQTLTCTTPLKHNNRSQRNSVPSPTSFYWKDQAPTKLPSKTNPEIIDVQETKSLWDISSNTLRP